MDAPDYTLVAILLAVGVEAAPRLVILGLDAAGAETHLASNSLLVICDLWGLKLGDEAACFLFCEFGEFDFLADLLRLLFDTSHCPHNFDSGINRLVSVLCSLFFGCCDSWVESSVLKLSGLRSAATQGLAQ